VAGSFDLADGRGALDLDSLPEEVAEWCLAIDGNLSECKPVRNLDYATLAHRAHALRAAGNLLEAAAKFRKAAALAAEWGNSLWERDNVDAAGESEAEYLKSVDASVDRLVDAGALDAAIRLLKQSAQIPTASRTFEDGYSAEHQFTERANELELVWAPNKAQLAELEERCGLVGEADRVLKKGRNGQRVWFCAREDGLTDEVVVSDPAEVLGRYTFDFSEGYNDHWLSSSKATLLNVTGSSLPELLVQIDMACSDGRRLQISRRWRLRVAGWRNIRALVALRGLV
jgi:tetratricopeptide (TPR) repeat protein